ncbi:MAG TPA: farnesyl diphosphate synthase [Solirubrobacteraceae bacterium]|nr:farnesyl diphosphate synthase [Solirubrobacteraceae bacterium]
MTADATPGRPEADPAEQGSSPGRHQQESAYPESLRAEVESYLEAMRFSDESLTAGLEEAMRYSLLAGGKRIRPVLALATARAIGLQPREVLPLAGAIELIHTYSLIHDDLPAMDDDSLRRGMPTCHVKYGVDVAILAGDGLYAEAFKHLLTAQRSTPERLLAVAVELAGATGVDGMVGGQYADVRPEVRDGPNQPSGLCAPSPLRRVHELKTGRLIGASVNCVLTLGGLDGPATMWFRRFAAELGVLFQIVDDILDVTGTDDALGKPRGSDERHGKRTYVSEFGIERALQLASDSHATAKAALAEATAAVAGPRGAADELEQIADFIYTRTS